MADDCIFCQIAGGKIPARVVFQDEDVMVFRDLTPKAPSHLLVIPKRHISSLAETDDADSGLLGKLLHRAVETARQEGLDQGFRTVINTGPEGGQTVGHLHLHVIGGRQMTWPPG